MDQRQSRLLLAPLALFVSGCFNFQSGILDSSFQSESLAESSDDTGSPDDTGWPRDHRSTPLDSPTGPGQPLPVPTVMPQPTPVLPQIDCEAGFEYVDSKCLKKIIDLKTVKVSASSDDGNVATNVVDGNFKTRWSASGVGEYLDLALDDEYLIRSVQIAFYRGDARKSSFRVQSSPDGVIFNDVARFESSGTSTQFENFAFPERLAKYIRVLGEGSSENNWNSYLEVMINKPEVVVIAPAPQPDPDPTSEPTPDPVPTVAPAPGGAIPLNQVDIVMGNDFEHRSLGTYPAAQFMAEWKTGSGGGIDVAKVISTSGNKHLRVDFPYRDKKSTGFGTIHNYVTVSGNQYLPRGSSTNDGLGSDSAGIGFFTKFGKSYEELYFGYRIFIPSTFNGVMVGKLPGICGGTCPTGGQSSDPNRDGTSDGFSTRFMWGGAITTRPTMYMYHDAHLVNPPCSTCGKKYGTNFSNVENSTIKDVPFIKGQWNTLVLRVVMNSLNNADGIVEAWLNGNLVIQRSRMKFRVGKTSNFGIDQMSFGSFFGGGNVACKSSNSVCLIDPKNPAKGVIRYSNGEPILLFPPRKNEYLLFDDVIAFTYKAGVAVPRGKTKSPLTRKVHLPAFSGLKLP